MGDTDADLVDISGFTLSTWIRPSAITAGDRHIFGNTAETKASVKFMQDGAKLQIGLYTGDSWSGNPNTRSTGDVLSANTWTHVALVWDSEVATLYVDGVTEAGWSFNLADGTLDRQGSAPTPTSAIGAESGSPVSANFLGNIDDFAIWNEALTATQIASLADLSMTPLTIPEPSTALLPSLIGLYIISRRRRRSVS